MRSVVYFQFRYCQGYRKSDGNVHLPNSYSELLGTGVLFRVVTPPSSVPLRVTSRSCEDETQSYGSTSLLRITVSFKFCLLLRVWLSVIGLNNAEYQKCSTQYDLHKIVENRTKVIQSYRL